MTGGKQSKFFVDLTTPSFYHLQKGDPYANLWETPPETASVICDLDYKWKDGKWMKSRTKTSISSVYEVHIGSWKKKKDNTFESLSYRELAAELVPYVKKMGFSHVASGPMVRSSYHADLQALNLTS